MDRFYVTNQVTVDHVTIENKSFPYSIMVILMEAVNLDPYYNLAKVIQSDLLSGSNNIA